MQMQTAQLRLSVTFKGIFCPLNLLSAIKKLENERNGLAQFYANLSVLKFGGGRMQKYTGTCL